MIKTLSPSILHIHIGHILHIGLPFNALLPTLLQCQLQTIDRSLIGIPTPTLHKLESWSHHARQRPVFLHCMSTPLNSCPGLYCSIKSDYGLGRVDPPLRPFSPSGRAWITPNTVNIWTIVIVPSTRFVPVSVRYLLLLAECLCYLYGQNYIYTSLRQLVSVY